MDKEQIIRALQSYADELERILSRFSHTPNGIHIQNNDNYRMRQISTELYDMISDHIPNSDRYARMIIERYNYGIANWLHSSSYSSVEEIKGLVLSLKTRIERNPKLFENDEGQIILSDETKIKYQAINLIINRFHLVARQLRNRYNGRCTLDVNDEYDVQDLLHSLLSIYFEDIRPEEWTPSYAGGSSRVDFLLPEINTIIEVKKTRRSLTTKELGEQLIIDIAKHKKHPQCKHLICFVYDPEGRIANPRGIEADLCNRDPEIDVQTIIVPKHL
jgi:hypothetical protein